MHLSHIIEQRCFLFPQGGAPNRSKNVSIYVRVVIDNGEGNGTPLQYSCLENIGSPGLQSMGSLRVGHD